MLVAAALVFIGIPTSVTIRSLQPRAAEFSTSTLSSSERLASAAVRLDSRGGGRFDIGSGVAVGPHVVLTNAHLTNDPATFVTRCDHSVLTTGQVDQDMHGLDLAAVVTNGSDLISIELASNDPEPGETVTMVGYPAGQRTTTTARVEGTLVRGSSTVLRFSPEPHPGQSGSPLVDADGKLVAIAFAEDTVGGQGLAIPVSQVREALQRWQAAGLPLDPHAPAATDADTPGAAVCPR